MGSSPDIGPRPHRKEVAMIRSLTLALIALLLLGLPAFAADDAGRRGARIPEHRLREIGSRLVPESVLLSRGRPGELKGRPRTRAGKALPRRRSKSLPAESLPADPPSQGMKEGASDGGIDDL